jgi:hypothetical protein
MVDFSTLAVLEKVEVNFFLKEWAEKKGIVLSHPILEQLCKAILQKLPNYKVEQLGASFFVDRGRVFWIEGLPSKFPFCPLKDSVIEHEGWMWEIQVKPSLPSHPTSWQEWWGGKGIAILPEGEYEIGLADLSAGYPGESPLRKWWNEHQVPAFLRPASLVIKEKNKVVHEFLTGKKIRNFNQNLLIISIEIKKN